MAVLKNFAAIGSQTADGKYALRRVSHIGTKLWCAKCATNTTVDGDTNHLVTVTEQHFDAVRLLFWNAHSSTCDLNAAIAPSASLTSKNTPTGSWVQVTKNGSASIQLAAGNANNPSLLATDWMECHSIDRSDGGTLPILMIRVYSASGQTVTLMGPGVASTAWETKTDGRILGMYRKTGDYVTTNQAGFDSTTFVSSIQVGGFQYRARGKVVTVMCVGDSIAAGSTGPTYVNEGYVNKAAWGLSNINRTPIEVINLGWGGQTSTQFAARFSTAAATIKPDIAVIQSYSTNDGTNSTAANTNRFNLGAMLNDCRDSDVLPIIANGIPRNSITNDGPRTALNAEIAAKYQNYLSVDLDAVVTDGANPADLHDDFDNGDGVHPNEAGHVAMAAQLSTVLRSILAYNNL